MCALGFFFPLIYLVLEGRGEVVFYIPKTLGASEIWLCIGGVEEEYLSCVFHSSLWVGGSVVSVFHELQLQDCRLGCCVGRACVCECFV
jgi:hypothetical protein